MKVVKVNLWNLVVISGLLVDFIPGKIHFLLSFSIRKKQSWPSIPALRIRSDAFVKREALHLNRKLQGSLLYSFNEKGLLFQLNYLHSFFVRLYYFISHLLLLNFVLQIPLRLHYNRYDFQKGLLSFQKHGM